MSVRLTYAAFIAVAAAVIGITDAVAQRARPNVSSDISIRSDSAPGWFPSENQRREAIKSVNDYLSELDEGRYESAYAMMSEANRRAVPFQRFGRENQRFRAQAGALKERSLLKVTWAKDPAAAPFPGIYAVVDVASLYEKIDRHCGFVVLYQKSADSSFEVMRQESNFIDNGTAQKIELQKTRAELDKVWAKLALNCPNYDALLPMHQ